MKDMVSKRKDKSDWEEILVRSVSDLLLRLYKELSKLNK